MIKPKGTGEGETLSKEIERVLRLNCPNSCDGYGTYAEDDGSGNPEPAQCQWCYEFGMPAREAIIEDREQYANAARLGELHLSEVGTDTEVSGMTRKEYFKRRYAELRSLHSTKTCLNVDCPERKGGECTAKPNITNGYFVKGTK